MGLVGGLVLEAALLLLASKHGDFLQKGEARKFVAFGFAAGGAYWMAARCAVRLKLSTRQGVWALWLAAVLLRLAILPVVPGDDLWRYRWEGLVQRHGINPYVSGPDAPELVKLRNPDWSKISHREYPAIYPPLTETIFAGLAAAGNSLWLYKSLFGLADLAGVAVLGRLLVQAGAPAQQAVWYAWNPLVVYSFAGAAHFDSLMILALLGAIWAMQRNMDASAPRADGSVAPGISWSGWLGALLLGVAIAIKVTPLILLPVWGFSLRSWRRAAILLPVTLAPLAIGARVYGFPGVPVFSTLRQFGDTFRVNDPVWWFFDGSGGAAVASNRWPAVGAVVVCGSLAFWFRHDWRRGALWVWGAALLLSPVVHAWYVTWVLPVAAWRGEKARAWFVFSISTFGYFLLWEVNHASGKPWQEPAWLRVVILLPPLTAMLWIEIARRSGAASGKGGPSSLNFDASATRVPR